MTATTHAHCTSCAYFDDHARNDEAAQAADDEGLCRFNPPVSQPGPDAHGLWPVVRAEDWCGHYAPEGQTAVAA